MGYAFHAEDWEKRHLASNDLEESRAGLKTLTKLKQRREREEKAKKEG